MNYSCFLWFSTNRTVVNFEVSDNVESLEALVEADRPKYSAQVP